MKGAEEARAVLLAARSWLGRALLGGVALSLCVGCGGRSGLLSFERSGASGVPVPPSGGSGNGGAGANLAGADGNHGGADACGATAGMSAATSTAAAGAPSRGACDGTLLLGTAPGIGLPDVTGNYDSASRIVIGDFDGDRRLDVVAIDRGRGSTVVRFYHREAGLKFSAGVELNHAVGSLPGDIVARDFTGDGKLDVAITSDSSVLLLRQGAASGLASAASFPAIRQADRMAAGDLDGDGREDLVVATAAADSLSVLFGQPSGEFAARVDYQTGFDAKYRSALDSIVGDLNEDGRADIAVADPSSSRVSVLFSGASGPFERRFDLPVGAIPGGLAAADFDGDGKLDLATAGDGTISVLHNQGHEKFAATREYPGIEACTWLGTADLDEDGVLDLVAVGKGIAVLLGHGDGTFEAPTSHGWGTFGTAAISDLDGDGHLDLVATQVGIVVLLGDGRGGFVEPRPSLISGFAAGDPNRVGLVGGIAARDVNRDGLLDLVLDNDPGMMPTDGRGKSLIVLLGDGTGRFTEGPSQSGIPGGNFVALEDFDNDGVLDGITTELNSSMVTLFHGRCDGTFESGMLSPQNYEGYDFSAADLNADGYLDLASLQFDSLVIFLNDGHGHFFAPTKYRIPGMLSSALHLEIADCDGDGILDAVVEVHEPDQLLLYAGEGNGAFHLRTTISLPYWPAGVSSGDLNADGRTDFVVADGGGATVVLAQSDGSYTTAAVDLQVGETTRVNILDMNGDHVPDILSWFGHGVSVALGVGDGRFATPALPYFTGNWVAGPVADFNRDGAPDIAFVSNGTLTVMLNGCRK